VVVVVVPETLVGVVGGECVALVECEQAVATSTVTTIAMRRFLMGADGTKGPFALS